MKNGKEECPSKSDTQLRMPAGSQCDKATMQKYKTVCDGFSLGMSYKFRTHSISLICSYCCLGYIKWLEFYPNSIIIVEIKMCTVVRMPKTQHLFRSSCCNIDVCQEQKAELTREPLRVEFGVKRSTKRATFNTQERFEIPVPYNNSQPWFLLTMTTDLFASENLSLETNWRRAGTDESPAKNDWQVI